MNYQVNLTSLHISEQTQDIYAKIIAEEDIKEAYGKETIIHSRKRLSRPHLV